jgi:hypothetical protein
LRFDRKAAGTQVGGTEVEMRLLASDVDGGAFGAAAGMGQCYLKMGGQVMALEAFRRALRINPNLDGVFPPANAAYLSGYELDPEVYDDFFDKVDWIGAFRSEDSAWHYNWSEFLGN